MDKQDPKPDPNNTVMITVHYHMRTVNFSGGNVEAKILDQNLDRFRDVADKFTLDNVTIIYPDKTRRYYKYLERPMPQDKNKDKEVPMEID